MPVSRNWAIPNTGLASNQKNHRHPLQNASFPSEPKAGERTCPAHHSLRRAGSREPRKAIHAASQQKPSPPATSPASVAVKRPPSNTAPSGRTATTAAAVPMNSPTVISSQCSLNTRRRSVRWSNPTACMSASSPRRSITLRKTTIPSPAVPSRSPSPPSAWKMPR